MGTGGISFMRGTYNGGTGAEVYVIIKLCGFTCAYIPLNNVYIHSTSTAHPDWLVRSSQSRTVEWNSKSLNVKLCERMYTVQ